MIRRVIVLFEVSALVTTPTAKRLVLDCSSLIGTLTLAELHCAEAADPWVVKVTVPEQAPNCDGTKTMRAVPVDFVTMDAELL